MSVAVRICAINFVIICAISFLELDDIGYALLVAGTFKNVSQGLPPLNRGQDEGSTLKRFGRTCCTFFYSWFILGFVLAIEYPLYRMWCEWDVDQYYRGWTSAGRGPLGDIAGRFVDMYNMAADAAEADAIANITAAIANATIAKGPGSGPGG